MGFVTEVKTGLRGVWYGTFKHNIYLGITQTEHKAGDKYFLKIWRVASKKNNNWEIISWTLCKYYFSLYD